MIHSKIFFRDFCFVMKLTIYRSTMYGQEAQDPSIQIQYFVQWAFPFANSFLNYFVCKNWWGGDELLKNSTLDGYVY